MTHTDQIDDLITLVTALDRDALLGQFRTYRANFPLDFTERFLRELPLERLRHIFLALCLQTQRTPEVVPQAA